MNLITYTDRSQTAAYDDTDFNALDMNNIKKAINNVGTLEVTASGTTNIVTFTNPYVSGSLRVYVNGVRLKASQFSETTPTTITLVDIPENGGVIQVDHHYTIA